MVPEQWAKAIAPFKALLFDLDGTLIDTMPLHFRAYAQVFADMGLDLQEAAYMALVGAPARVAIPKFVEAAGGTAPDEALVAEIHGRKKDAFDEVLRKAAPLLLPCAALLAQARGDKACALVSSGNRRGVTAILAKLGWTEWFNVVVTGDDVETGKPHPEPFLRAARALNLQPGDCLVFEDTADGLAAARAAGMTAIDVAAAADS